MMATKRQDGLRYYVLTQNGKSIGYEFATEADATSYEIAKAAADAFVEQADFGWIPIEDEPEE